MEKSNIFVEGFVRSGTTFSSLMIQKSYPDYTIIPKTHQLSSIKYCMENDIPCFVCIRDPIESISSWIYFEYKNIIDDDKIFDIIKWNNRFMEFTYNNKNNLFISDINYFSKNHFNILNNFSKKYNLKDPKCINDKDVINELFLNEKSNEHRQAIPSNNYKEKDAAKKIILNKKFKDELNKSIFYYKESIQNFIN